MLKLSTLKQGMVQIHGSKLRINTNSTILCKINELCLYSYLNLFFELEQRSFHNVPQLERISFHLVGVVRNLDTKIRYISWSEQTLTQWWLYLTWSQVTTGAPCFTDLGYSLPVAHHHSFVSHELQQGTALAEFIDGLLQVQEGLPLFQSPRQLATSFSLKSALVDTFKAKSLFLTRHIFMLTRRCELPFSNQSKLKHFIRK